MSDKPIPADDWDEERAARAAFGDYVRKLKRRVDAPAEAARLKRERNRAEVHRLRHREGKSIGQAMVATGLKRRYVIELGMDVDPGCTEECINDPKRLQRRRDRGEM